jgi:hypothetical protein
VTVHVVCWHLQRLCGWQHSVSLGCGAVHVDAHTRCGGRCCHIVHVSVCRHHAEGWCCESLGRACAVLQLTQPLLAGACCDCPCGPLAPATVTLYVAAQPQLGLRCCPCGRPHTVLRTHVGVGVLTLYGACCCLDTMQRKWCCETLGEGIRTVAAHAAPACCCAVCQCAHIAQVHARVGASLRAAACVCLECSLGACRGGLQSCTGLPALKGGCWCNMQCVHVFARDAHLVHVEAACNFALAPACTKGGCWWQCVHT